MDILFKLGRSYIENTRNTKEDTKDKNNKQTSGEEDIEVIEEEEENLESLNAWTKSKMRGFKRVNPSAPPSPSSNVPNPPQAPKPAQKANAPPTSERRASERERTSEDENRYSGKYCHFFVNTGNCRYEERTGQKCKFEHKKAPMCNFGTNCSRPKCMFAHPRVNGNNLFLGQMRNF